MDKKIFLFDKEFYNEGTIKTLTEKDCEEWVSENDYEGDNSILKIDANGYDTIDLALEVEVGFLGFDDFYIRAFGFGNEQKEVKTILDNDILNRFDLNEIIEYLKGFKEQGYTTIYEDDKGNIVVSKVETY